MIKGSLLVKVVVMEKCCKGAAEEERVSVWWWVASVEVELEASALDERGAVAGADFERGAVAEGDLRWWVSSVEAKSASAFDERGAVAGGDLPVTGSMSLQPDTEQLGNLLNSYIFGPKYNWHLSASRTDYNQEMMHFRRIKIKGAHLILNVCLPLISCLTWRQAMYFNISNLDQMKEREERLTWRQSLP